MEHAEAGDSNGPETLPFGSNFYDQEPFRNPTQTLVSAGIDPNALSNVLSRIAKHWDSDNSRTGVTPDQIQKEIESLYIPRLPFRDQYTAAVFGNAQNRDVALPVLRGLIRTPLLIPYIASQRSDDIYSTNGSPREAAAQQAFEIAKPKTYRFWLAKQRGAAKSGITHGIGEVFPQKTAQQTAVETGKGIVRRDRITLEASELAK